MTISSGTGLISGINYESLISQLIAIERQPITNLNTQKTYYQTQISLFQSINRGLTDLQDALSGLTDSALFNAKIASSSNNAIATISATNSSEFGTYSLKVLQMAQADRLAAAGFVDSNETGVASSSGVFKFKIGDGSVVTINVDEDMTLEEFRNAINSANAGVRATIINDGTPTSPYRLILTGQSVGATNQITITQNDTNLNFSTNVIDSAYAYTTNAFNGTVMSSGTYTGSGTQNIVAKVTQGGAIGAAKFVVSTDGGVTFGSTEYTTSTSPTTITTTGVEISFGAGTQDFAVGDMFSIDAFNPNLQEARDAIIQLDGITITRGSNVISDAIEGVTINLHSASSTETVTLEVEGDDAAITNAVSNFVDSWGDVNALISAQLNLTEDNEAMPLFGDFTLRMIHNRLATMLTGIVGGTSSNFNSLASIGITITKEGALEFDTTKFNEVIQSNKDDVRLLFQRYGKAVNSSNLTYISATSKTKAGTYAVYVTSAATQALVNGNQAIRPEGLVNDEKLTFTVGESALDVNLTAGDTITTIVSKINSAMTTAGWDIKAEDDGGVLKLRTNAYGSSAKFKVISDQDGGTDTQTGIGTTEIEGTGTNIQGTIGGKPASGNGLTLTGLTGYSTEGLSVRVENNAVGFIDNINFSQGIFNQLEDLVDLFSNSVGGSITERVTGLQSQVDDIDSTVARMEETITKKEESLRAQFTALETLLSSLYSQQSYLTTQLDNIAKLSG